jgi:PAS domain S-box-containing protein
MNVTAETDCLVRENQALRLRVAALEAEAEGLRISPHGVGDVLKLRRDEMGYRSLFENAIMGISQASPDGRLIRVNQAHAQMYGYSSPQEMIAAVDDAKKLYANPDDRAEVMRILTEKGVMEPREVSVVRRNGSRFVVLLSAREIRDTNANLVCCQTEHVDVTARKQAEDELRFRNLVLATCCHRPDGVPFSAESPETGDHPGVKVAVSGFRVEAGGQRGS